MGLTSGLDGWLELVVWIGALGWWIELGGLD